MEIPLYRRLLSPEEYCGCVRNGAALPLVSGGRPDIMEKVAQLAQVGALGDFGLKSLMWTSLITGIPVGIVAHVIGKRVSRDRMEQKKLKLKAEFYDRAARNLEKQLAAQGAALPGRSAGRPVRLPKLLPEAVDPASAEKMPLTTEELEMEQNL